MKPSDLYQDRQGSRGVPKASFVNELFEIWKQIPHAAFEINDKIDIFTVGYDTYGPWLSLAHRRAAGFDMMVALAGRESSWDWDQGRDTSASNHTDETEEAGAFQTSYNARAFSAEGRELVKHLTGRQYINKAKSGTPSGNLLHTLFTWYTLRNTINHHGPVKREEIVPYLNKSRALKIQELLAGGTISEPTPELPKPKPEPAPTTGGLWYPKAIRFPKPMKTVGYYPNKWPMGAIVHFTCGWSKKGLSNARDCITLGIKNGYAYFCIANDGNILQAHPLDKWGSHAGKSKYSGLGTSVSSKLVGIEICNAGKLKKSGDGFVSSFGEKFTADEVRHMEFPKSSKQSTGYYAKYTAAQEKSLMELLVWLKKSNPAVFSFDYVLGHDEVSLSGKNDPGGSLIVPMPEFRELLKKLV